MNKFHDVWNFFSSYVATEFVTNLHVIIGKYKNFEYTLLEILEFRAVCSFIEFRLTPLNNLNRQLY